MTEPTKTKPKEVAPAAGKKKSSHGQKPTDKQKVLMERIKVNLGKMARGEKADGMYEMMIAAGYSESSAKQQTNIINGLREDIDPLVAKLDEIQEDAIERIPKAATRANYRDLMDALERTFKMKQVLKGKPTQRTVLELEGEPKKYLDDILKANGVS